jgi:hypothetical protein
MVERLKCGQNLVLKKKMERRIKLLLVVGDWLGLGVQTENVLSGVGRGRLSEPGSR